MSASYTDPDVGDTHSFSIDTTSDATKGEITNNGDGTFTYDPSGAFASLAAGQTATDSFLYTVTDAARASSTATVTITITGQNGANTAPVAVNVNGAVLEHGPATTVSASYTDPDVGDNGVLSNDVDPNGKTLTAVLVSPTSHGTLTLNKDGSFTYQSAASYVGTDNFTYKANDGVLSSNVASVQILVSGPPTQTLKGTPKDDNLSAFSAGSTYIIAEAGNDIIHGGSGSDWIDSGPGNDQMWGGAGADLFIIHGSDVVKSNTDRINDLNFAAGDQILLARFGNGTFAGGKSNLPTGIDVNGLGSDYAIIGSMGNLVSLISSSPAMTASKYGSNDLAIAIKDTNGDVETLQLADMYSAYLAAGGHIKTSSAATTSALSQNPTASNPDTQVTSSPQSATGTQPTSTSQPTLSTELAAPVDQPLSTSSISPLSGLTNLNVTFASSGGVKSLA